MERPRDSVEEEETEVRLNLICLSEKCDFKVR